LKVGGGELKSELAQGIGAVGADQIIKKEIPVPGFYLQAGEAVFVVRVENVADDCEGGLRHDEGPLIGFEANELESNFVCSEKKESKEW
jgi:hypothetical protein